MGFWRQTEEGFGGAGSHRPTVVPPSRGDIFLVTAEWEKGACEERAPSLRVWCPEGGLVLQKWAVDPALDVRALSARGLVRMKSWAAAAAAWSARFDASVRACAHARLRNTGHWRGGCPADARAAECLVGRRHARYTLLTGAMLPVFHVLRVALKQAHADAEDERREREADAGGDAGDAGGGGGGRGGGGGGGGGGGAKRQLKLSVVRALVPGLGGGGRAAAAAPHSRIAIVVPSALADAVVRRM